jgi:hypothetical protein
MLPRDLLVNGMVTTKLRVPIKPILEHTNEWGLPQTMKKWKNMKNNSI